MEWKRLSDKHKLQPGEVVIESSVGRLILCHNVLHYDDEVQCGLLVSTAVTDLEYMEE